jgi:hypothetical protein
VGEDAITSATGTMQRSVAVKAKMAMQGKIENPPSLAA